MQSPVGKSRGSRAYILVFIAFGIIGVGAVVLSLLFREYSPQHDIVSPWRMHLKQSVYVAVISRMDEAAADCFIASIKGQVSTDTGSIDFILGSTIHARRCAHAEEFYRLLRESLLETGSLNMGKQQLIIAQMYGLLTKDRKPAVIFVAGTMDSTATVEGHWLRARRMASEIYIHHSTMAPASLALYLLPPSNPIHQEYADIFRDVGVPVQIVSCDSSNLSFP